MDIFEQLRALAAQGDITEALQVAATHFHESRDAHRLFEVRKMQARHRLSLPVVSWQPLDELAEEKRIQLENALLDACLEMGAMLVADGRISSAWTYLEPLEDRASALKLLKSATIDGNNLDEAIEVAFHRGVDPAWGMELILQHYGTCNAITLFDSATPYLTRRHRREIAEVLVRHFSQELLSNLRASNPRLAEMTRDEFAASLKENANSDQAIFGGPHVDATHLNSVTRIGRNCETDDSLSQLLTLCRYGEQLAEMFQFEGDPPFESHYRDHRYYFAGLLNEGRARAIEHFAAKLHDAAGQPYELFVIETIVDWLGRMGEVQQAIDVAIGYQGDNFGELGIAPSLVEMVLGKSQSIGRLQQSFQSRGDLLKFLMLAIADSAGSD